MVEYAVRRVREADVADVVRLVHELAAFERAPQECHLTAGQLGGALFAASPALFGHVAEADGTVVGCALWFLNFSTWRGTHGIYLEDLHVRQAHRGAGLGKALLRALAVECRARGYQRLEWSVLDWNTQAIGFYEALGADCQDEWKMYRLSGPALADLAGAEPTQWSGSARR